MFFESCFSNNHGFVSLVTFQSFPNAIKFLFLSIYLSLSLSLSLNIFFGMHVCVCVCVCVLRVGMFLFYQTDTNEKETTIKYFSLFGIVSSELVSSPT